MRDIESLANESQEASIIILSAPYGWVGFSQPSTERSASNQNPNWWDIPEEIWENKDKDASAKRAAWVLAHRPDVSQEELTFNMSLHDDEIAKAKEFVRYEEAQNAYSLSPDDDPRHPKVFYKIKAGEMEGLNPEILRVWTRPEIADRIITLINDRLSFSDPETEGEIFIFWRKPESAEADELELDAAWFPQKEEE